jgi:alkyl hydroperoxide reductase subunit AhpC
MSLRIGDVVPNFLADTTEGPINFYEWQGAEWVVLFSHPSDFTPVCTTELGAVAALKPKFAEKHTKVIGLSVDSIDSHRRWVTDIEKVSGHAVNFPLIADPGRQIAKAFDMIHPNASDTATVRSVFVIGPDHRVKLTLTYPASTGRNFHEILRVVDSLQLTAKHSVATPADWKPGADVVILPSISDDEARRRFPAGFDARTPYLRITPQPGS